MKEITVILPDIIETGDLSARDVLAVVTNVGLPGLTGPPGTSERKIATYTTSSLAAGASETGTILLATGYKLLHILVSADARVRLYTRLSGRTADISRLWGVNPTEGVGCTFDWKSSFPILEEADITPTVEGYSMETSVTPAIPITVTNVGVSPAAITVTLTYVEVHN